MAPWSWPARKSGESENNEMTFENSDAIYLYALGVNNPTSKDETFTNHQEGQYGSAGDMRSKATTVRGAPPFARSVGCPC